MKPLDFIAIAIGVIALISLLLNVQERHRQDAVDARIVAVKEFRSTLGSKYQEAVGTGREEESLVHRLQFHDRLRDIKRK